MIKKISVIIPCFNSERYISETLSSVYAQNWSDLEVIVVDDGSTDRSASIIADVFPQVKLIRQKNQGVAVARNNGIRQATGDWIAFVDSDDIWLPGKLEVQSRILAGTPDVRMCYTAWKIWDSAEPKPSVEFMAEVAREAATRERWEGPSGWIYTELLEDCVVWTSTVMAHRSLFEEIGLFNAEIRIGEDYDLWLRASRVTRIVRVPRPLALYRIHTGNITRKVPRENYKGQVIENAIDRWGFKGPDGQHAPRGRIRRSLARSWSDFGSANLICGELGRAKKAALKAISLAPFEILAWTVLMKSILGHLRRRSRQRET